MSNNFSLKADMRKLVELLTDTADEQEELVDQMLESAVRAHLLQLDPTRFEALVGRALERRGFRVAHHGGRGDEGVDLLATKGGDTVAVQCKRYDSVPITPNQIREFLGAMVGAQASRGVFVTTSTFSDAARAFAARQNMELVDSPILVSWLTQQTSDPQWFSGDRAATATPKCSGCGVDAAKITRWTKGWVCSRCHRYNALD
jgi:restriction endonuclease Mrr